MLSREEQDHLKRLKQVSYKLNLPEEVIDMAINYTSEYIKKKISEVVIDRDRLLSKEEFENLLPIIKIPAMGYFKPNYYKYLHMYKRQEKNKNQNNK